MEQLQFSRDTEILYQGSFVHGDTLKPEAPPLYPTTAFLMDDLDMLHAVDSVGGYSYSRGTNPTRDALNEVITNAEGGEASLLFSAGMGAITSTLLTFAKKGDHVIANKDLYGETIDFLTNYLSAYGVESTYVSFSDLDAVRSAMRPNTRILYSEVISNPLTNVVDIRRISEIAHLGGALYCVDSTFTTPYVIRPLEYGVDLVIHSLTKYFNGHSDASGGSVTGKKELIDKISPLMLLLGNSLDPYTSYAILRGVRTMGLRVRRQNENAIKLAAFLASDPHVLRVNHPSLETHPQHALAKEIFSDGYYGAIISFSVEDDVAKLNEFMHRLQLVRYLPSLGGYRTTLSQPVSSSHHDVPEPIRLKMGIHDGMLRISVGCEDIQDLITDFSQALTVFQA